MASLVELGYPISTGLGKFAVLHVCVTPYTDDSQGCQKCQLLQWLKKTNQNESLNIIPEEWPGEVTLEINDPSKTEPGNHLCAALRAREKKTLGSSYMLENMQNVKLCAIR